MSSLLQPPRSSLTLLLLSRASSMLGSRPGLAATWPLNVRLFKEWWGQPINSNRLPTLQDTYLRCMGKVSKINSDNRHPIHMLLFLLSFGRHYRSIRAHTSRLRDSFYPQAIWLLNRLGTSHLYRISTMLIMFFCTTNCIVPNLYVYYLHWV